MHSRLDVPASWNVEAGGNGLVGSGQWVVWAGRRIIIVNLALLRLLTPVLSFTIATVLLAGCAPELPAPQHLELFHQIGTSNLPIDTAGLPLAKVPDGPYRVVTGDTLVISMPFLADDPNAGAASRAGAMSQRVDKDGCVNLPMVNKVQVSGKTLVEVEAAIVAAYYPSFVADAPLVLVQIGEYDFRYANIIGAVGMPGRYQLRSDERSLVSLLQKAGNISIAGAAVVKISKPGEQAPREILVPIKGLNQPIADVELTGGETVEVQKLDPQTFTILGLVRAPGTYPFGADLSLNSIRTNASSTYPLASGRTISLIEAIGVAGGPDPIADPRFATIYRQTEDNKVVSARFEINKMSQSNKSSFLADNSVGDGAFVQLKPGDIIYVEKDSRTRARAIFNRIIAVTVGANASADTQATYYKDYSANGGTRVR
jgi:protein involved in polysaccharide export with SLBB domain